MYIFILKNSQKMNAFIGEESLHLILISSDGGRFNIDKKSAEKSGLLKGLIVDFKVDAEIPLQDVSGDILEKIVEYLVYYKDKKPKEIPRPLQNPNLLEVTDKWDVDFIYGITLPQTVEMINSANFMDIRSLLDLACARIACIMLEKPVDEARRILGIECDMTDEEIKEYDQYKIE
jgi:S-phase kinase-associated protein 1